MASLAPVIDAIDSVAEPLRQFYEQRDGKFHLSLSGTPTGYVAQAVHAEFRNNNIALLKEVDELRQVKAKFEGIDPEAAKAALTKVKELETKGVTKPDDIQAQITAAVSAAVGPLKTEVESFKTKAADAEKRAADAVKRSTIGEAFTKAGGEPSALDFIVGKAEGKFIVEDGKVRAAQNVFSIDRPGEPLSVEEWLVGLTKESPFAFKPSSGGGAEGGPKGGVNRPANQQVIVDPTPQQLGDQKIAKGIQDGTVRFEYTK